MTGTLFSAWQATTQALQPMQTEVSIAMAQAWLAGPEGEAAGSTYAFTGEGIGKALETGLMAAEALVGESHAVPAGDAPRVRSVYEARLAALKPRFDLYDRANQINAHPWLADLVIWRARRSPRLLRRMSGVLEETSNPGNLVSLRGLWKVLFPPK